MQRTFPVCQLRSSFGSIQAAQEVLLISAPTQAQREADELQTVLSSEAFTGSRSLANLLKYLFINHFSADKGALNEYRIGVEALGRPANFDPAKNSSVRVEVHRLREKLRKYYETEGANHSIRIILEEGRYGLQFIRREDGLPAPFNEPRGFSNSSEEHESRLISDDDSPGVPLVAGHRAEQLEESRIPKVSRTVVAIATTVIIAIVVSAWLLMGTQWRERFARTPIATSAPVARTPSSMTAENGSILILCGYMKDKYVDRAGRIWGGDRYFTGGVAVEQKFPFLQGTTDPTMYRNARVGEFSYDIPVNPGPYELRLYFAETTWGPGTTRGGGEASRIFSVVLNEKPLLSDFDVLSNAGENNLAYTRVFKDVTAGSDGKIHLTFKRQSDIPFVNAIELVPQVQDKVSPVRIVMQESSFLDHAGRLWDSDRYASGGVLVAHRKVDVDAADPYLFNGERYGHFTYQIPVAPGRYTVTLYFTEAYFGTDEVYFDADTPRPNYGNARIFDVYANGVSLLRNFDILQKAGKPNKAVTESFHGIEPNAAGQIVLSFVPVKNYACVNAIEVTDESQ
jgi:hypothetical protein